MPEGAVGERRMELGLGRGGRGERGSTPARPLASLPPPTSAPRWKSTAVLLSHAWGAGAGAGGVFWANKHMAGLRLACDMCAVAVVLRVHSLLGTVSKSEGSFNYLHGKDSS